ncbi:MAG: hypothetical protein IPO05_11560 [Flavobacteriales bacterium]|jgi:hypothetical protein|nr:hypothetical protein [Flavobacteriales bacterium]
MWFIFVLVVLPIVPLLFLVKALRDRTCRGAGPVRLWVGILVVFVLVDPVTQVFLLEPVDNRRGAAMARMTHAAGIIGMDHTQVRELLGEPTRVHHYQGYEPTWEYKQVPGYWSGSHFQVFFTDGRVHGVEPNDD